MSNLPHPLGSSVAGELFYPGPPHVTAYSPELTGLETASTPTSPSRS